MRSLPALRRSLLAWYRRHQRALPWRASRDPYRIWVSEVMLQQTTVAAVQPYYEAFLARFPDVRALATARVEDLLALWSGLGYYRRARHLHAAARAIVERHAGRFPRELAQALALPGVGPYTARAVLSIAYGVAEPVVDGNVRRVLARLLLLRGRAWRDERAFHAPAAELLAKRSPGDWNQAVMELGATVCTPRAPACPACPWRRSCAARAQGLQEQLPERKPRSAPRDEAPPVERGARGRRPRAAGRCGTRTATPQGRQPRARVPRPPCPSRAGRSLDDVVPSTAPRRRGPAPLAPAARGIPPHAR